MPEAYLEHLVVGSMLAEMPLFLDLDRHIILPLKSTYMTACRGMPAWPARSPPLPYALPSAVAPQPQPVQPWQSSGRAWRGQAMLGRAGWTEPRRFA